MSKFNQHNPIHEIAAAYPDSIQGLTFLVTGATSGLRLRFSKFVAQEGANTVVLIGRSEEKLAKTLTEVQATASRNTIIKILLMDNESRTSVEHAANQITSGVLGIPKIDVVLNNAGIMAVDYKLIDGFERHFYCNHLSHFLFTNLIISHVVSPGGRIITTSSATHVYSGVRFNGIKFQDGKVYDKWLAISESKGIESFVVHPGIVNDTGLNSHLDPVAEGFIKDDGTWQWQISTVDEGVATYLYTAVAPELNGKGGSFLFDSAIQNTARPLMEEDAEKLWELSNRAFGTSF